MFACRSTLDSAIWQYTHVTRQDGGRGGSPDSFETRLKTRLHGAKIPLLAIIIGYGTQKGCYKTDCQVTVNTVKIDGNFFLAPTFFVVHILGPYVPKVCTWVRSTGI